MVTGTDSSTGTGPRTKGAPTCRGWRNGNKGALPPASLESGALGLRRGALMPGAAHPRRAAASAQAAGGGQWQAGCEGVPRRLLGLTLSGRSTWLAVTPGDAWEVWGPVPSMRAARGIPPPLHPAMAFRAVDATFSPKNVVWSSNAGSVAW